MSSTSSAVGEVGIPVAAEESGTGNDSIPAVVPAPDQPSTSSTVELVSAPAALEEAARGNDSTPGQDSTPVIGPAPAPALDQDSTQLITSSTSSTSVLSPSTTFTNFSRLPKELQAMISEFAMINCLVSNKPMIDPWILTSGKGSKETYRWKHGLKIDVLLVSKDWQKQGIPILYGLNTFRFSPDSDWEVSRMHKMKKRKSGRWRFMKVTHHIHQHELLPQRILRGNLIKRLELDANLSEELYCYGPLLVCLMEAQLIQMLDFKMCLEELSITQELSEMRSRSLGKHPRSQPASSRMDVRVLRVQGIVKHGTAKSAPTDHRPAIDLFDTWLALNNIKAGKLIWSFIEEEKDERSLSRGD